MTTLHDAIQQARKWADGYKALLDGFGETVDADTDGGYLTVVALLEAIEAAIPHMVDTRRITPGSSLERSHVDEPPETAWKYYAEGVRPPLMAPTAAEALAAAEREAGR